MRWEAGVPADGNSRWWFSMGLPPAVVSEYEPPRQSKMARRKATLHGTLAPSLRRNLTQASRSDKVSGAHRDLSGCGTTGLGGTWGSQSPFGMDPAAMELGVFRNSAGKFAAAEMQNAALFDTSGSLHWAHLLRCRSIYIRYLPYAPDASLRHPTHHILP
jgi:hypothetical protein